jgi:hypothetical protein
MWLCFLLHHVPKDHGLATVHVGTHKGDLQALTALLISGGVISNGQLHRIDLHTKSTSVTAGFAHYVISNAMISNHIVALVTLFQMVSGSVDQQTLTGTH